MADREPVKYTVTLHHGYKVDVLTKSGIKVYTSIAERYRVGIRQVLTPGGHMVACYDSYSKAVKGIGEKPFWLRQQQ